MPRPGIALLRFVTEAVPVAAKIRSLPIEQLSAVHVDNIFLESILIGIFITIDISENWVQIESFAASSGK